ncbi:hypothetical protein KV692_19880 [Xanthomonas euvesicatoria pv. physalidis]|uniref:hypothetical protein n=1 Tax=Xanthomonas euvesicatoria TaxID=456327 RepID=UPI001C45C63B|nr:hypothetical protein [Xanthomonas euvesicatoria]MBV6690058.1 hypothetical protein [Xanthomonas euvesicatoria pv. physalidis]
MNYEVVEQCHCTPYHLSFVRELRVKPSLAQTSGTNAKTLRSCATRCIAKHQFDTPLRAVRRRDLAALKEMLDRLHEAASCDRALTNACEIGFLEGVRVLFQRASTSWMSGKAFLSAAKNGQTRVAIFLLRTKLPDVVRRSAYGASLASSWGRIETAKALVRVGISEWPDDQSVLLNFIPVATITGDARLIKALLDKTPGHDLTYAMRLPLLKGNWECASLIWDYLTDNARQRIRQKYGQQVDQMIAWQERLALMQSSAPVNVSVSKACRRL